MIDPWNRVLTNIKKVEPCKNIVATTSDTPSSFPTLAVEQIDDYDYAVDLENTEAAVLSRIRLQAFSKKSLSEARKIISDADDAMRRMGYRRYFGPQPIPNLRDGMVYRIEAKYRRMITMIDLDIPIFDDGEGEGEDTPTP